MISIMNVKINFASWIGSVTRLPVSNMFWNKEIDILYKTGSQRENPDKEILGWKTSFCLCRSQLRAIQRSRREGESRFRYNPLMAASATQNGFHGVQTSLILSKEEYIVLVWTQLLPMKLVWKLTVKKVTVTEGWEQPCLHPVALSLSFSKSTMSRTFFSINANDNFSADRKSTGLKDHSAIDRRYSQILPWKIYIWYLLHLLQIKLQCLGISTLGT